MEGSPAADEEGRVDVGMRGVSCRDESVSVAPRRGRPGRPVSQRRLADELGRGEADERSLR